MTVAHSGPNATMTVHRDPPSPRRKRAMSDPIPFGPIDVRTADLAAAVYGVIGAAIRDNRLAPGARLRDVELAEWLGVSRTPVREALLRLERIGLVEMVAGRFTRVSIVTPEIVTETLEYMGYQVAAATRMAVHRMQDDELAETLELADRIIAVLVAEAWDELFEACSDFYGAITLASGNAILQAVMFEAAPAFHRNLRDVPATLKDHELLHSFKELRNAVAARDGDTAESLVRRQHGIYVSPAR